MRTIPFDIEKAKAGAKVVTRSGNPVRILCYDAKASQPIVAAISLDGAESVGSFHINGAYYNNSSASSSYDLMLEVESKYVPFTWETSKDLIGKVVRCKIGDPMEVLITARRKCPIYGFMIFTQLGSYSAQKFLEQMMFLDGSPCGTLEE